MQSSITYFRCDGRFAIFRERVRAVVHYTVVIITDSIIRYGAIVIFVKIVFSS